MRILNQQREKQLCTYKDSHRLISESFTGQQECQDICKMMKVKNLQVRILDPTRLAFKFAGERKGLTNK